MSDLALFGGFVIVAFNVHAMDDMAARPIRLSPKRARRYFDDCTAREDSRWFMKDAVSACRTRLKRSSRAMLPGASFSAASLNFRASSAKRSSKVAVCLTRLRC